MSNAKFILDRFYILFLETLRNNVSSTPFLSSSGTGRNKILATAGREERLDRCPNVVQTARLRKDWRETIATPMKDRGGYDSQFRADCLVGTPSPTPPLLFLIETAPST